MNTVTPVTTHMTDHSLPDVLRLVGIYYQLQQGGLIAKATVFDGQEQTQLCWRCEHIDPSLQKGHLVERHWHEGMYIVTDAQRIMSDVNLIETIPPMWCPKPRCLDQLSALWKGWPPVLRTWFNAVFWYEPQRLKGFVSAPASMQHHHAYVGGLLTHSVDCAQRALRLAQGDTTVDPHILSFVAVLHDVGKAQEYLVRPNGCGWTLSQRGALIGHKLTALEWLAAARVLTAKTIPESVAMTVYHALTATYAPDYVGLRSPRTPEAIYMGSVDKLSGQCDLLKTGVHPYGGFGKYHKAFGSRPYTLSHNALLA